MDPTRGVFLLEIHLHTQFPTQNKEPYPAAMSGAVEGCGKEVAVEMDGGRKRRLWV